MASKYPTLTDADFPPLKNDLLLRAARGEETERAPTWIMRQAGRYLPEFRKLRESHSFFEICQTPELACAITLQPIHRYTGLLDASIIFSDILVVPQALGLEVQMLPSKGPHFPAPLRELVDVARLREDVDVEKELGYVFDAITLTRRELKGEVPLIGFSGAPWTLFAYMVEGGGSKTLQEAKRWLFSWPEESTRVIERVTDVVVDYLVGQVKAGAQALQVFDSWASELSPRHFRLFSLPSLLRIASSVRSRLTAQNIPIPPLILFAKGVSPSLFPELAEAGYDVLGLDWATPPSYVDRTKVAVQGNLDPNVLYGDRAGVDREVKAMAEEFIGQAKGPKGWIANLGHGITPGVDPENLRWTLECIQKYSARR